MHSGAYGIGPHLRQRRLLVCGITVGLVSLGLYLATLAPGLTWAHDSGDGGELAAAARTLGIAHPPGYPTYLLLAHVFTLLPVGEVAVWTNLFSALCAATTSVLLAFVLMGMTDRWSVAIGAGLALSISPLLWSQATVTEVHALNGLFTALLLVLLSLIRPGVRRTQRQSACLAMAVGCVWGLSLGNHPTALFCAPLAALALWRLHRAGLLGAIGVVLGLAVYLYLPLRAAANPPINWGDPRTLDRFWWMVSGTLYHPFLFSTPIAYLPVRLLAWANVLSRQFGWIGLMVTALGGMALWETDRASLGVTSTTVALCSIFAIAYNTSDSYLYLVPALVSLGLWLGMGLNWLLSVPGAWARWTARMARLGAVLTIALALVAAICRFPVQNLHSERTVYDFEATVLGRAPAEALILSQRDTYTFSLWYFQHALGRRSDVTVVDLGLLEYNWYTARLSRRLALGSTDLLATEDRDFWQAIQVLDRPVCTIASEGPRLVCSEP